MEFILARSEDLGIGVRWRGGPTFLGLVVVFPMEDEKAKKKRGSVQTGPLDISVIAISPFRFFFYVSGMA